MKRKTSTKTNEKLAKKSRLEINEEPIEKKSVIILSSSSSSSSEVPYSSSESHSSSSFSSDERNSESFDEDKLIEDFKCNVCKDFKKNDREDALWICCHCKGTLCSDCVVLPSKKEYEESGLEFIPFEKCGISPSCLNPTSPWDLRVRSQSKFSSTPWTKRCFVRGPQDLGEERKIWLKKNSFLCEEEAEVVEENSSDSETSITEKTMNTIARFDVNFIETEVEKKSDSWKESKQEEIEYLKDSCYSCKLKIQEGDWEGTCVICDESTCIPCSVSVTTSKGPVLTCLRCHIKGKVWEQVLKNHWVELVSNQ